MLENDITDVLDLTFTAESDFFGKTEVVELVPGGRDIRVTEGNKHEYVNLIARHRMTTSIKAQIQVGSGRTGKGTRRWDGKKAGSGKAVGSGGTATAFTREVDPAFCCCVFCS